ncbi:MAG: sugar phosphate isomerase/epimerase family protein [Eubacteriales bacterium]
MEITVKLCFSTLGCTEKSLGEIITLAKSFSVTGIEIRGIGGQMDNREIADFKPEKAIKTKKILSDSGIVPVVLGSSCMFHTEELYKNAMREGRDCICIAESLGIPHIRVFGNNIAGDRADCIRRVENGIAELCGFAAERNVSVLLEVHGDYNTEETLSPILDALEGYDNFGLIWDIAHSHRVYGENWRVFYRAIRPYIRHIHIKDYSDAAGALTLPGEGDIPILPIVRQLSDDGYDGYFSLEWEKKWHPELPAFELALARFTELMKKYNNG